MGKNVVAYCRVSTENQTGEDKYGIDAQREDIEAYCAENDLNIVKWYIEEAVSGAKDEDERPELKKILNGEITNPPIKAVVIAKNDRLSREIEKYYGFKYLLRRNNIDVISVQEDFGMLGMYAPVYEAISTAFAQLEREFITIRMGGGRAVKAARGGYSGGKAPYGYSATHGGKELTVNEEEAKMIRRIFEMKEAEHKTLQDICDSLKSEGYVTRKGGDFQISTIQYILKNRKTYEGYYKYGKDGEWVKGMHKAILDEREDT